MNVDINRLFPEAARRAEILEGLKRSWASIVGVTLARNSQPYNLGVNYLDVATRNDKVAGMLHNMKGTIQRKLSERYGYKPDGDFSLKVTKEVPRKRTLTPRKKITRSVKVDDEDVKKYMQGSPETLPEEINYSLSHLRAYLEKRKGR